MGYLERYWQGKKVIVTGASSGLGWSVCEALAKYNIHFGLISRREEKMQELADKLKDSGSKFWIQSCDIQKQEEVDNAIQAFAKEAGGIDVVWVNSGVSNDSSMDNWDWQKIENMIETNLKGAIYTTKASLDVMIPQGHGAIVGIGSAASMRGLPRRSVYSATKIAVQFFLEGMAVDYPEIQFTTIHPGFVDTPLNDKSPQRLWVINSEQAAQLMIKAVAKRKHVYIYPWKMRLFYHFVRKLPQNTFYKMARKKKHLSRPPKDLQN